MHRVGARSSRAGVARDVVVSSTGRILLAHPHTCMYDSRQTFPCWSYPFEVHRAAHPHPAAGNVMWRDASPCCSTSPGSSREEVTGRPGRASMGHCCRSTSTCGSTQRGSSRHTHTKVVTWGEDHHIYQVNSRAWSNEPLCGLCGKASSLQVTPGLAQEGGKVPGCNLWLTHRVGWHRLIPSGGSLDITLQAAGHSQGGAHTPRLRKTGGTAVHHQGHLQPESGPSQAGPCPRHASTSCAPTPSTLPPPVHPSSGLIAQDEAHCPDALDAHRPISTGAGRPHSPLAGQQGDAELRSRPCWPVTCAAGHW